MYKKKCCVLYISYEIHFGVLAGSTHKRFKKMHYRSSLSLSLFLFLPICMSLFRFLYRLFHARLVGCNAWLCCFLLAMALSHSTKKLFERNANFYSCQISRMNYGHISISASVHAIAENCLLSLSLFLLLFCTYSLLGM